MYASIEVLVHVVMLEIGIVTTSRYDAFAYALNTVVNFVVGLPSGP